MPALPVSCLVHRSGVAGRAGRFRLVAALVAGALAMAAAGSAHAADKGLTVFDWSGGYEDPKFHPAYVAAYGDSPSFVFFGDEEEAFQKLKAGFRADVAHPCSQSLPKWRDAGLLKPIDPAKITGWNEINPAFKAMKDFMTTADGKAWIVPFEFGNTELVYRTDKIQPEEVTSLAAFADPKFADRVSIGDNVADAYALAALATGVKDWTAMSDAEFAKASDFLRKVHKNVKFYWTDNTELAQAIANGEIDLAWAWNETPTSLKADGQPVAANKDTKEGLTTWVCGYVLLEGGKGDEQRAYAFLNAINDPKISGELLTTWGYGHANAAGMASLDPAEVQRLGFGDPEKFFSKTLFQSPLPPALAAKMNAEFEKIKAGH